MTGATVRFMFLFLAALLFWIVTTAWLVREEILPYFRAWEIGTYRAVVPADRRPRMAVYEFTLTGGRRLGEARSLSRPLPEGRWTIETRMHLRLVALGEGADALGETEMRSRVDLDREMRLDRFESRTQIGALPLGLAGRRVHNQLEVTITLLGDPVTQWVRFDPAWTISDDLAPLAGAEGVAVGQRWLRKTIEWDLAKRQVAFVNEYVGVTDVEEIDVGGRATEAYRVEFRRRPTQIDPKSVAWVTKEGEVLAQEVQFGTQTLRGELRARWVPTTAQIEAWDRGEAVAPSAEEP